MWCCKNGLIPRLSPGDDTAAIVSKLSGICSQSGVEKNCFLNYHAKTVCLRPEGGNLNAYNVLKQGGIVKADDYANSIFIARMIDLTDGKHVAYHANKKAANVR